MQKDKDKDRDKNKNRFILFCEMNIVIPMIAGAVFYYLFCPNVFYVRLLDRIFNISLHFEIQKRMPLFLLIRNHGIDFLWGYSFSFLIYFVVNQTLGEIRKKFLPGTAVLCCITEFLQIVSNGTFDWVDIGVLVLSSVCSFFIIKFIGRIIYEKKI